MLLSEGEESTRSPVGNSQYSLEALLVPRLPVHPVRRDLPAVGHVLTDLRVAVPLAPLPVRLRVADLILQAQRASYYAVPRSAAIYSLTTHPACLICLHLETCRSAC